MGGRYLLDTNILIALFANDTRVKQELSQADEVFIPSIAIGELCFGARKSVHVEDNLKQIDDLGAKSNVLSCDIQTARTQWGN